MDLEPWRQQLLALLDVARLGAQFPDVTRWRALLDLLGRDGPRGRPLRFTGSAATGLPTRRTLTQLHRLQFVAREFLAAQRQRPTPHARAFSLAIAALELPPVTETSVRLVARGSPDRFVLVHERLEATAVRFTAQLAQHSGRHVLLGRDELARPSAALERAVRTGGGGDAVDLLAALSTLPGLEVSEVVRGELGPFVGSAWAPPPAAAPETAALRAVAARGPGPGAILSVTLERLGAGVSAASHRDPWRAAVAVPLPLRRAHERRLFCTPHLEAPLKAALTALGQPLLVRSR